ncbi:MAG: AmmeMemoRadiSam system protein A [Calditrichaeota bacterium]|nr:AmmeMemoRadiSam system protein A [Calditrichota bacterium]
MLSLNEHEKRYLLRLAREAIAAALRKADFTPPEPPSPKLKEHLGVFVTLHEGGQLRGCIGLVEGIKPLHQAVAEMAVAAAFQDPRFNPLQPEELDKIDIEISVLSPLKKIERIEEIQVGTHGLFIKKGYNRGLLLPQVATEWGWDREVFLSQTCLKAGLPGDCWQDAETEIYIFSAEIFSEQELGLETPAT